MTAVQVVAAMTVMFLLVSGVVFAFAERKSLVDTDGATTTTGVRSN